VDEVATENAKIEIHKAAECLNAILWIVKLIQLVLALVLLPPVSLQLYAPSSYYSMLMESRLSLCSNFNFPKHDQCYIPKTVIIIVTLTKNRDPV
jgi:hypothetical protein